MPQATFQQSYGLGTVTLACSFRGNGGSAISSPVIRDGLAAMVDTVSRNAQGVYYVNLKQKLGRCVSLVAMLNGDSATTVYVQDAEYDDTNKRITIRIVDAAGAAADPDAGVRFSVVGYFSPRSDLRDAA